MKLPVLITLLLSCVSWTWAQPDLVLLDGKIATVVADKPFVEALAIKEGRLIALGSSAEIKPLIGSHTKVLMLDGAFAMPGFIDGHAHLTGIGISKMILDLTGIAHWDEAVAMVAAAAAKTPKGQWITGRGWHQDKWNRPPAGQVEGYPVHAALSAVSPDNPVMLVHASGHALFANAKAMALAGVGAATKSPEGGKIVRDGAGQATGIFEENAESLIKAVYQQAQDRRSPAERKAETLRAIDLAIQDCLAKGITSLHDAGVEFGTIDLYKELAEQGKLGIRLWVMAGANNEELAAHLGEYRLRDFGDGFLTVGGIKKYMDGALGSRGAWLLQPYADLPTSSGQNVTPLESLARTAQLALEYDLQLCVHAIGDRGNREVLDLYEKALAGRKLRWRIEHAQHLNPADIPRFAKLGVIASMQGIHCTSDAPFVEKRLGHERAQNGAYVWRELIDTGAIVTNGTDAPVEDVAPLPSLYAMVTRKRADGTTFFPEHRLNVMEAIRAYTLSNAYAGRQEQDLGSLEIGKRADITVLTRDLTAAPAENILQAKVRFTIVNGKIAYAATP